MSMDQPPICSQCAHPNLPGARFCSSCGARTGRTCSSCGTMTLEETARFCSQCGSSLAEAPSEPPSAASATEDTGVTAAPPSPIQTGVLEDPPPHPPLEILSHKAHRSQRFYTGIFLTLVIITIIEVAVFYVDNAGIRISSLFLLSIAKFAMVVMFFMHLKGDRRFLSGLFVIPLLLSSAVLISLVALVTNI